MTVRYHETVTKLQAPAGQAGGPFDRCEWFALLERHGARPTIAAAGNGENATALVLEDNGGSLRALRHVFAFTWRPLGSADPQTLTEIARDLRRRSFRVDLPGLAEEAGEAMRLHRAFADAGWIARLEPCDENHVLRLNGRSFAEYWAARPGPLRTSVKRKAGKVALEILDRFDETAWKDFQKVYAMSWKSEEKDHALLEDFARMEGEAGRLRLGIARHEDEPVAAQFWTVEDGTAFIHKLAYDDRARKLSAGTVLSWALFDRVIDVDKVELVDFGTGSDGYKADWMEDIRLRHHLTCIDPRQWRGAMFLLRKALARLAPTQRRR